jgi:hypothetical protein
MKNWSKNNPINILLWNPNKISSCVWVTSNILLVILLNPLEKRNRYKKDKENLDKNILIIKKKYKFFL